MEQKYQIKKLPLCKLGIVYENIIASVRSTSGTFRNTPLQYFPYDTSLLLYVSRYNGFFIKFLQDDQSFTMQLTMQQLLYQIKVWYRVQQSRKLMLELLKCTSTAKDIAYTVKLHEYVSIYEYVCKCLLYVTDKKKCALYFQHTNRFIIIYFEIKTYVDTLVQFAHTLTSVHEYIYLLYIVDKNAFYISSVLIDYFEIKIHTDTLVPLVHTLTSL